MKSNLNKCFAKVTVIMLFFTMVCSNYIKAQTPTSPVKINTFLSTSDIHFNPFFDPSLINKLINASYTRWAAIFDSSAIQQPNGYNSDSNYPLLKSALNSMRQQNAAPAFIIISGDFLCHNFQSMYAQYAVNYPDSLQSFISKTINFLAWSFNSYFPKTVVLPVLGNNDSYCNDYTIPPDGPFLNMFAKAWVPLQRNASTNVDNSFIKQFSKGGYYTYSFKHEPSRKLLMLNTVFFSAKYVNSCNTKDAVNNDPGAAELNWLTAELEEGKIKKQSAWLVYHIPPGIDVHSTLRDSGSCSDAITFMWKENYNNKFLNLIFKYAAVIKANLAGHTHMDNFAVIYNDSLPVSFIHITPAITPLFSNNPGFQHITYNPNSSRLLNSETFYLKLNQNATSWAPEYNFNVTYNEKEINEKTLDLVRQKIAADTIYLNKYIRLYKVSNPLSNEINQQNWKAFWCGTGMLTRKSFVGCYCK